MRASPFLAILLLLATPARAERPLSASVRTAVAIYPSDAVSAGPAVGVELSAGLVPQLAFELGGSVSRHGVAENRGGGHLDVEQAGAGFSYLVDEAPVLPYLHAGVMAAYRTTGRASAFGPWPYLGASLLLPVKGPLTIGLDARYAIALNAGLAQFGYAQLGLVFGVGSRP